MVNPFARRSVERYLQWFDKPFSSFPRELIRCQFHDSFEYAGNWAADFPDRFKAARGYDLHAHAAELSGQGDPAKVAKVKYDYRRTLDELITLTRRRSSTDDVLRAANAVETLWQELKPR